MTRQQATALTNIVLAYAKATSKLDAAEADTGNWFRLGIARDDFETARMALAEAINDLVD